MTCLSSRLRQLLFVLFFVSGFCGLLYQVVWTRMAFASFGIITPVLSVVLSVFMLGLAVGAWAGGKFIASRVGKGGFSAVVFYAGAELLIGLGALAVPALFDLGKRFLLSAGQTDSIAYLSLSAMVLALFILPWCLCMGATFPLMMAYVREKHHQCTDSFSYLYLANVLGAMSGALLTAVVLIELLGFRHTLWVAATGNLTIAVISGWLGRKRGVVVASPAGLRPVEIQKGSRAPHPERRRLKWILFATGFVALAMEVVWVRAFTPVLKTQVYSFALVVFVYLGSTFCGSLFYRRDLRRSSLRPVATLIAITSFTAFLPIVVNDARLVEVNWDWHWNTTSVVILLASICPFCAALGYLTPGVVDEYSAGSPEVAGRAYAANVLGCILGPLAASYVLLPLLSERAALILLGLPFLVLLLLLRKQLSRKLQVGSGLGVAVLLVWSVFFSVTYDDYALASRENAVVRRDYAGSVISCGLGRDKRLFLNGIGTTSLTPITKWMAHLPLAFHRDQPSSALIICFGMGTSYRSALSWDIETTTVELVPSVIEAFGFYHADAEAILRNPKGHIIIDDGRRYLVRSTRKFDVIVVDPPPPPEAAGSSLLYSDEFYELVKQRLNPGGILHAWLPPGGDLVSIKAVLRSISDSFSHIRCFGSVEGWGVHILCSREPIERLTAGELAARMPARAGSDLLEWAPTNDLAAYLGQALSFEMAIENDLHPDPKIRITDDRPCNEYFLLRRWNWISY
jgi:spermidine synthase